MGKITVETIGTIKIKMDVRDDVYYDAKDPHISFVRRGDTVVEHCYLSQVDNVVGTGDSDLQKAIRYCRDNKEHLINLYKGYNS